MSKWISAKDALPPQDAFEDVLAVCYGKIKNIKWIGGIEFAYHEDGNWYLRDYSDENGDEVPVRVTYWMPIPEPPEGEGEPE